MTLQSMQAEATRRLRVNHAQRTADSHAAFLLPHLRSGMDLLDLGCGPGTITVGLAAAVAPGNTTGLDLDPVPVAGVEVVAGDVMRLPFADASFDAIYIGALLQHLPDPLGALREARRVARPGAVIGVADADWDGELRHPDDDLLRASLVLARKLREGTSPNVGKQLRDLLGQAGFVRAEGYVRAGHHGSAEETRAVGASHASLFEFPAAVARAVDNGWATVGQLQEMNEAWLRWGEHPGAFLARFWCEAVAWAPD